MNATKRSFVSYFLLGHSSTPMFFIVYIILSNISLFPITPISQLQPIHEYYSRNLAQLSKCNNVGTDRNNSKKNSQKAAQVSATNDSDKIHKYKISPDKEIAKSKKLKELIKECEKTDSSSSTKEESCDSSYICDARNVIYGNKKQLSETEIEKMINALEIYPHKDHVRKIWLQVCKTEEDKFYNIANYFFTLYIEIKHKYKVRKENFRKNVWKNFHDIVKIKLSRKRKAFDKRLNGFMKDESFLRAEFIEFTEDYKNMCTKLREELFSMCQVEIAQVMLQLPWWKGFRS
ncbi:Plasmodium exported protein, unknown function [Plasmodium gonderi]|uniref:Plasmodium RESA N-terminal domain-containing protein n=1 Tax=Plasmodium gonderi TaxID=77519 RepID=A0A1Y1JU30_PLAGO|nr:Plasmodium exported protein, unknown function [Plasmodium gonderi]GAW84617.1 Plasmodium exported protein, unknown function [Plasmodium gonderi]